MSSNITIVGFTGSVRTESHNKAALRLAQELLPTHASLDILEIEHLSAEEFNTRLQQADAIFIATPEYKGLLSRVLKNALSQVAAEALTEKPTAIISVGRSNSGTHEHEVLRALLGELNADILEEQVSITAHQLADETTHQRISALLTALVERVEARLSAPAR